MAKSGSMYGIMIATGTGPYRWISGWDALYATLAEARAAAKRASANDGWSARVVEITADEAAAYGYEVQS